MSGSLRTGLSKDEPGFSSSNGSRGSNVADIVLPAHRRERAAFTSPYVVGCGWKFSARDRVDRIREPLLRVGERFVALVRFRKERDDTPRTFEREIDGFTDRPATPARAGEPLLGADAVDRQLQRAPLVRR